MFSKKLAIILVLLILASGLIYLKIKKSGLSKILINNHEFEIEIADTNDKRGKGLSGRKSLGRNQGMLFIFPNRDFHQFWMFEMNFPLDFIWIKDDDIVDLTQNVQPPKDTSLPKTFTSKVQFNKVLEINSGVINTYNIKVGDKVIF